MPLFGHVAGRKQISALSPSPFLSDALILASKGLGGPGGGMMWCGHTPPGWTGSAHQPTCGSPGSAQSRLSSVAWGSGSALEQRQEYRSDL